MLLWLLVACGSRATTTAALPAPRIVPEAPTEQACPPPDAAERTHCVLLRPAPQPGAVALQAQLADAGYIAWLEGIDVAVELDPASADALLGQRYRWERDGARCLAHLDGDRIAGQLADAVLDASVGHRVCE